MPRAATLSPVERLIVDALPKDGGMVRLGELNELVAAERSAIYRAKERLAEHGVIRVESTMHAKRATLFVGLVVAKDTETEDEMGFTKAAEYMRDLRVEENQRSADASAFGAHLKLVHEKIRDWEKARDEAERLQGEARDALNSLNALFEVTQ